MRHGPKLCLNGHEWAKRQLDKRGIVYEALDNGFLSCADPQELQGDLRLAGAGGDRGFSGKWLKRMPLPLRGKIARPVTTGICRSGRWK